MTYSDVILTTAFIGLFTSIFASSFSKGFSFVTFRKIFLRHLLCWMLFLSDSMNNMHVWRHLISRFYSSRTNVFFLTMLWFIKQRWLVIYFGNLMFQDVSMLGWNFVQTFLSPNTEHKSVHKKCIYLYIVTFFNN